jgi:Mn2+/Fe2+ NRAMP family transporter
MSTVISIVVAVGVGVLLTFSASRATATVHRGRTFLRWMVIVFVTYLALISLPVLVAF